jgi:enolase
MTKVQTLKATEILDSRDDPTIEVSCELSSGATGMASVPSGASKGVHEALELRDGDENRYGGLGVLRAVNNVNEEINQFIHGKDFDQHSLDQTLIHFDGTENKSRLGANAILGVSLAFARASAKEMGKELFEYLGSLVKHRTFDLPQPMFNIINGGKHADSGLDLQEFMIVPMAFDSIHEKVRAGAEIIDSLKKILINKGLAVSVGDEGGFAPKLSRNEEAIELIEQAIKEAGYSFDQIKIGIDAAASSFYKDGNYNLKINGEAKNLDSNSLINWYKELVDIHPIISIEDGLAEDDWDGFAEMTKILGNKIKIVGDDLTVTNIKRIQMAKEKKAINAVLIKLNQIGTLSETIDAIEMTRLEGWSSFVSHRSGETTDTFIADLAVGLSCDFIKSGSLTRGERVCKYNRLMEIEDLTKGVR